MHLRCCEETCQLFWQYQPETFHCLCAAITGVEQVTMVGRREAIDQVSANLSFYRQHTLIVEARVALKGSFARVDRGGIECHHEHCRIAT